MKEPSLTMGQIVFGEARSQAASLESNVAITIKCPCGSTSFRLYPICSECGTPAGGQKKSAHECSGAVMDAPQLTEGRECRICRHYEWNEPPGTYGQCLRWAVTASGRLVATNTPESDGRRYLAPPGPGFCCCEWEARA